MLSTCRWRTGILGYQPAPWRNFFSPQGEPQNRAEPVCLSHPPLLHYSSGALSIGIQLAGPRVCSGSLYRGPNCWVVPSFCILKKLLLTIFSYMHTISLLHSSKEVRKLLVLLLDSSASRAAPAPSQRASWWAVISPAPQVDLLGSPGVDFLVENFFDS